jgi:glucosamine--fructose-6-phosphate aminotransferase (isomerizing)
MTLRKEILEQPQVLRRLLQEGEPRAREIARAIRARGIDYIFLTARGTSDNAGLYAKYLWGAMNGLPTALAAPSLFSIYHRPPRLHNALVVGISQSGQSPDIVQVVQEGRRQGAPTLAIVNKPDSPLAEASEFVLDVRAGEEQAVAATKSYTAQLMAIAMLAAALADDEGMQALHRVPGLVEEALGLEEQIERAAERYRYMTQCIVLGRGYNYATAYEWSLKLKELTYVLAEPYSSADFRHGPIAVVERGFPVLAVTPRGAVHEDLLGLLQRLAEERRAELVVVSNEPQSLALAQTPLPLPAVLPEWISPLVSIVPGQLFCYYLTRAKAYDTEQPRGLQKVTRTR